ncbi:cytochrome-c peroxidase [Taibaiella koreensis]|uniref:cytochrome-c peroxidase n=1 Tax=Taibaiella koreensis TaxID=1268548 RepID=UPI000E5997B4|nr:cytochrome c peroxidase [Taibaiella koreensis]
MKRLTVITIIALLFAVANLAGKDKRNRTGLTPYTIPLPAFVGDYFDKMPVDEENPLTEEGIALGRRLFYDKRLSAGNTLSCGSCHQQSHAFADNRPFSLGVHDSVGIINTMPLFNLGWARSFFWDGRAPSLREQVTEPLINRLEMAGTWADVLDKLQQDKDYPRLFGAVFGPGKINSTMVAKALTQFELTLVSFNTRFDQYYFDGQADALTPQEERGLDIFFGFGNCNHCHSDVLLTDNYFRNNGLDLTPKPGLYNTTGKESDRGRVKVPSLRNIALTAPYMHDGRFQTLEEVLDFYSSGIHQKSPNIDEHVVPLGKGLFLTAEQKADLIAFLNTLTDSSFIRNPAFSDPNPPLK